jgi:hypothetical protein
VLWVGRRRISHASVSGIMNVDLKVVATIPRQIKPPAAPLTPLHSTPPNFFTRLLCFALLCCALLCSAVSALVYGQRASAVQSNPPATADSLIPFRDTATNQDMPAALVPVV